tara:strand:+ start:6250 stop:6516 length:267 start_codon:yes stop_codon:yes gene_type:complete
MKFFNKLSAALGRARRAMWRNQRKQRKHTPLTHREHTLGVTPAMKRDAKHTANMQRALDGYRAKANLVALGKGNNTLEGIPKNIRTTL